MEEIWKDIEGFESIYQVSNHGRVRSLDRLDNLGKRIKGIIRKISKQSSGHNYVLLSKNGKPKRESVHRLVGNAFIPNPNNLPYMNHKDENPDNNRVENLEWCTVLYNNTYNNRHKKIGQKLSIPIYVLDGECDYYFESTKKASDFFGLHTGHVAECLKGRAKTHKGFKYEYA